jgi:predicted nucleic acid-binding protein
MASSPSRVGWDSCTWIAYIQQEKIRGPNLQAVIEDRGAMCRHVLQAAEKGVIEIVVSALCLVEVLARNRTSGMDDQKVRDFFDNDCILLVNLDKQVGDLARGLMLAGHAGLKPPDAVHLATACVANVDEFHTFDQRLLALDRQIDKADGTRLIVRKPTVPAPPAPLLDEIERGPGRR